MNKNVSSAIFIILVLSYAISGVFIASIVFNPMILMIFDSGRPIDFGVILYVTTYPIVCLISIIAALIFFQKGKDQTAFIWVNIPLVNIFALVITISIPYIYNWSFIDRQPIIAKQTSHSLSDVIAPSKSSYTKISLDAGSIRVLSGTYGLNCGAVYGNQTTVLSNYCNEQFTCNYLIDYLIIGDPAPNCSKDYSAKWQCGDKPEIFSSYVEPEAGFKKTITLTCPNNTNTSPK